MRGSGPPSPPSRSGPEHRRVADESLERAWRDHWGRLLALLVGQFRRVDLAEDALADAFSRAAQRWPGDGVPQNPPAWLLTASRRRLLDVLRAEAVAGRRHTMLVVAERERADVPAGDPTRPVVEGAAGGDDGAVPDERLRLAFLCCHPALRPDAQSALAMRLVLGLPTAEIARLFLVAEPTMAARLTRAKRKIARAGIPFALPPPQRLDERMAAVVRAVYLAFTAGYAPGRGPDLLRVDLAGEAIRLGRVLDDLMPGRPDVRALLVLMTIQHSRRDARICDGHMVLLADQDRSRWHHREIGEALTLLRALPVGRGYAEELRLQALIAAEHAVAPASDDTAWPVIAARYAELDALTASPVVRLNRAVAVAEADGPAAGLVLLDGLDDALPNHHRVPAVRAELLTRVGDPGGARAAYRMAIERCGNEVERRHLEERLQRL